MVKQAVVIDIDDLPEVERLTREVRESGTPRVLRRGGEEIALLSPIASSSARRPRRETTEAEREAFRATAGGWAGLVDGDELIERIYADREIAERPPAEL